jgi:ribonucleoside-diphosphate reductase beta chain
MGSLINLNNNVDFTKEPLFFGEKLNIQRYDKFRYSNIFGFFKQQLGFFWRPEEVSLTKDIVDFGNMTEHEKFIFTKNLAYQTLLDSAQSRGIPHLLEDCSNPEFEAHAKAWEFYETIHSYAYTYIIKNVYSEPSEIFDNILDDEQIVKRATSVSYHYDQLIDSIGDESLDAKKKQLYLTLVSINILEGIRFYVSFACSYAFAENQKMEGNAKIISLINRDENLHLGGTQLILNLLREKEEEGFKHIVEECEETVINMFRDAAEEEMEWAKYLFKDGSMLGLNDEILIQYMKYLTNKRMKAVGLEPIFDKVQNPISWINAWTSSKGVQEAPQETEKQAYLIGSIEQDVDKEDFSEFNF